MGTEGLTLKFAPSAVDAIAKVAVQVNTSVENIGARHLQTVIERVLDDISFSASDRAGDKIVIDGDYVEEHIGDLGEEPRFQPVYFVTLAALAPTRAYRHKTGQTSQPLAIPCPAFPSASFPACNLRQSASRRFSTAPWSDSLSCPKSLPTASIASLITPITVPANTAGVEGRYARDMHRGLHRLRKMKTTKKNIVFNQTRCLDAELAWVLNCVARIGSLNRMTQFKDKDGKDRENASMGLLGIPVLMAADILIYRATHLPVGETPAKNRASRTRARHCAESQR